MFDTKRPSQNLLRCAVLLKTMQTKKSHTYIKDFVKSVLIKAGYHPRFQNLEESTTSLSNKYHAGKHAPKQACSYNWLWNDLHFGAEISWNSKVETLLTQLLGTDIRGKPFPSLMKKIFNFGKSKFTFEFNQVVWENWYTFINFLSKDVFHGFLSLMQSQTKKFLDTLE